jgi:hypothetical protein
MSTTITIRYIENLKEMDKNPHNEFTSTKILKPKT